MAILKTEAISKLYPGCRALDEVSVSFDGGKVHALLGKNGSGKSTLVKIFSGVIEPSQGTFFLDDEQLSFKSPSEAYAKGLATVYQEMSLVPGMTVAENIFLGRLPKKAGGKMIDWRATYAMASELLQKMNVDIDPREKVSRLSMWQCQVVEITKAMSYNPKVLMLDEPTSALAQNEVQSLFAAIKRLKEQGVIIIYISHKLHEIPEIADTVTVLRDGKYIGKENIEDIDNKGIIHMMFGEVEIRSRPKDIMVQEELVLEVKGLSRANKFSDISFALHGGEVLGIAGMLGSGRTELLKSIFGADPYDSGSIAVGGTTAKRHATPIDMKALGLGLTPEDRKTEGLILTQSIMDNLSYASLRINCNGWVVNQKARDAAAYRQVEELSIKIPDIHAAVSSLSGGNQQKVVVGNWLNTSPGIMLYDEPSRGIDVNAKQQIFEIMWAQARKGISTIFVSSELEELLEVCHRILIMRQGQIIGEVHSDEIKIDELYAMCMGGVTV